jgi:hypothetical protein
LTYQRFPAIFPSDDVHHSKLPHANSRLAKRLKEKALLQISIIIAGMCAIVLVIVAAHRSVRKENSTDDTEKAVPLLSHANGTKKSTHNVPPNA